jgi:predicted dithiol-disulfide oxidoreductase (DUF899 family)
METEEAVNTEELTKQLVKIDENIHSLRKQRLDLLYKLAAKELDRDYEFVAKDGSKKMLSEMFGDKKYLYTVHNMGKGCSYCTMWADGFNDTFKYIEKKGAFALISFDGHETHKKFSESRGWKYNSFSDEDRSFSRDMGFMSQKDDPWPGVSVFEKGDDGKIRRVAKDWFGPTDFYCNVWHFYDMLPTEDITVNS